MINQLVAGKNNFTIIHFISGIKSGGVEHYLINYSKYLSRMGIIIYVIYQHSPHKDCLLELEKSGCICLRIANKRKHPILNLKQGIQLIKHIKPDIVECHEDLANFFPLISAKLAGAKIRISHIHSNGSSVKLPKLAILIIKSLIRFFATNLVACSYNSGKYVYKNKRFKVIPNAIDISSFKFDSNIRKRIRNNLGIDNSIVIGHVGRLTEVKNHRKLFLILKELLSHGFNYKLIIIGSGELEDELKKYKKSLNLSSRIIFLGEKKNVSDYYSAMDIMVIPSFYEGGPIVSIEGQASGLPIILSQNVNKGVKVLNSTNFENVDSSVQKWCKVIIDTPLQSTKERLACNSIMKGTKYNLGTSERDLLKYYFSIL